MGTTREILALRRTWRSLKRVESGMFDRYVNGTPFGNVCLNSDHWSSKQRTFMSHELILNDGAFVFLCFESLRE